MTYVDALDFLFNLQKHGIKLGLDTVAALLDRVGNPHRHYPTLHIGGTNGKGSTAAMAASILQAAGYRVGLYTSPHLVDFRERIRVNGHMISPEAVVKWTDLLRTGDEGTLDSTFFEFTTAMAFAYFSEMNVDVAVIEVGMGGRFDATNVVHPLACVITNVALDHETYLGPTVSAIAFEKAGIVKTRIPLVIGHMSQDAWDVIREVAQNRSAPVYRWGTTFKAIGDPVIGFTYTGIKTTYHDLTCPLPGRHQLENAGCALALLELAGDSGFAVSENAVRSGLQSMEWEGRLEVIEHQPMLILDGAHNPAAGAVISEFLGLYRNQHPDARVILVVGFMRDKDRLGFFKAVLPVVDEVVATHVQMARAVTVEEIRVTLRDWTGPLHLIGHAGNALAAARKIAGPTDLICVTGSLMLIGEIKAILRGCEASLLRG